MQFNPLETYFQEAEELLAEIEQSALALGGERAGETIHQLFRAFHTIKGSGAMCGLEAVAGFTHHVESLLDLARCGTIPASDELAGLVLKARDHIKLLIGAEQGGAAVAPESTAALVAAVQQFAQAGAAAEPADAGNSAPLSDAGAAAVERTWKILFRPNPALFTTGGNPLALLQELRGLGPCEITAHTEEIPTLETIQPDTCYLGWTIMLRSACELNEIRDVFIFVEDDSKVEIELAGEETAQPAAAEVAAETAVKTGAKAAATSTPDAGSQRMLAREATVRVPSNRLDRLVNLVGELVMNQSRLAQAASQSGAADLANPVQELERLVAELRDDVLGIRMLPIGTLFGRFRRLVHDLSAELGKEVDLVTEGAETELDKSILDQLGEPLVHCLRNSLDHGVEPPEERVAKGKPRRATIRLSAVHVGSDVVVGVQDDGRGIDRAAVRAKAIERRLIPADAALSAKDVVNLVLLPGFSTAKQVTSVSGRGVGMDAVRRQIDALRGTLSLESEEGRGTRTSITLPLTLAIIDGLLVQIGADQFIIPMAAVTENVELLRAQRERNNGRNVIAVRGELIPYIDLRSAFAIGGGAPPIEKVVIVRHEDARAGLVVDRVLGTHQTVIQSLGKFFRSVEVVSGATIMGDGRVALIMDIAAVVRRVDRECQASSRAWRGAEPEAA